MSSFPKHTYIRSKKLLMAVCTLECQNCGYGESQASHANWGGGRGMGKKADDNLIAALCLACHYQVDFGKLTRAEKRRIWTDAHRKTVEKLVSNKQWPIDIPIPNTSEFPNE